MGDQAKYRLGFIGAGRMATALGRGLIKAGLADRQSIVVADPVAEAAAAFQAATGGRIVPDNLAVCLDSQIVILAVKPQHLVEALAPLKGRLTGKHLIVSIAAGVRLSTLAERLGPGPRLVRVMPNTPCLVGESASGYALGPSAAPDDAQVVEQLLGAVGIARRVDESLLDAITGLSGSGPAFVYLMIEALSDGGVRMGLPRDTALALAAQTVAGAARMVLATGEHPAVLKDQVTSPGGTTIAGIQALEAGGFRAAVIAAVEAASRRATELGTSSAAS